VGVLAVGMAVGCTRDVRDETSGTQAGSSAKETAMRAKAPYRLLYNNDTTCTTTCVSPWHEEGELFREEMLVASIEEVANRGVDAYLLSPGMGWVPWWQSKVEPDYFEWWKKRTGLEVIGGAGHEKYVYEGGDVVRVLVETCRKRGMAPFVSLRLNDVHHQEHYANKNQQSLVSCRFYVEHPEWHLDPKHRKDKGYQQFRGMDWTVPEVRQYKLALLKELAANYDLAGIELDFLRHSVLFREESGLSNPQRIEIIADFCHQVREALDRRGPGRHLCVRIPIDTDAHAFEGIDVRRMYKAGVDMFNLSGWYHTTQQTDLAEIRRLVPNAAVYLEMTHSTGRHHYFHPQGGYGTTGDVRTSDHEFYTTALLARKRGADGMSLFNFVYYRMGHRTDQPVTEPPFHVLPKLNDTDFLARQSRCYTLANTVYHRQVPHDLAPGESAEFKMDMVKQDAKEPDGRPARLRLHTRYALTNAHDIAVRFNGTALEPTPDTTRFFGNPFDPMISPRKHRRAWLLPRGIVKAGLNTIEVTMKAGKPIKIVYLDVGIP